MRISRDTDNLRFIGECDASGTFVPGDIQCVLCGRRIDPQIQKPLASLTCSWCGHKARTFWSETEMNVFLAENWNLLREACCNPAVRVVGF
jgi:hypothetical protein